MPIVFVVGRCRIPIGKRRAAVTALAVGGLSLILCKRLRFALDMGIGRLAIARVVDLTFGRL